MVCADGVHDFGFLLVLFGQLCAEEGVRQFGFGVWHLADIVQKAGAFRQFRVEAEFCGHGGAEVGHLLRVLQQVLSVGGTVAHLADHPHQFVADVVDTEVDAGAFSGLVDFLFDLFLGLGDHLFDTGGVDTSVGDQFFEGTAGDFAAHGVEAGEEDGVRRVVNDDIDAGEVLEGADVTSFTADDAALDVVVFDGEDGDGVFEGGFHASALDGLDNQFLGFECGGVLRFIHNLLDGDHRFGAGLVLHQLDELFLGLFCRKFGDGFEFRFLDGGLLVEFGLLEVVGFNLAFQFLLEGGIVGSFAVQLFHFLVEGGLLLFDAVLAGGNLLVLFVDHLFVLAFQLQEFFLGLENLLFFKEFAVFFGLLLDGFRLVLRVLQQLAAVLGDCLLQDAESESDTRSESHDNPDNNC